MGPAIHKWGSVPLFNNSVGFEPFYKVGPVNASLNQLYNLIYNYCLSLVKINNLI